MVPRGRGQSHAPQLPWILIFCWLSLFPGPNKILDFCHLSHILDILTPTWIREASFWYLATSWSLHHQSLTCWDSAIHWCWSVWRQTLVRSDSWSQCPALHSVVTHTHCCCQRCRHWPQERLCYHNCKFEASLWLVNVPLYLPLVDDKGRNRLGTKNTPGV